MKETVEAFTLNPGTIGEWELFLLLVSWTALVIWAVAHEVRRWWRRHELERSCNEFDAMRRALAPKGRSLQR